MLTKYPRAFGALFATLCFAGAWWYAQYTLWLAETKQVENITVVKVFPALIGIGMIFLGGAIFGKHAQDWSRGLRTRKKTAKDIAIFAVILLPALVGYFWLVFALKERGYEIL